MAHDPLPHLETFAKAAELSSFTAAARALGMTQAAVSQRIHVLEQAVDTALFHRQGGRITLTPAGQRLYPFTQQIFALHQQARQAVTGDKTPLSGELALAASSVPGEHLLPALLTDFHQRYPKIKVRVTVGDSRDVLGLVEHGDAQLGMVGRKDDNPHLEFRPFDSDRIVLVVPADHAWRRRRQVSLLELSEQPLILREVGSGSRACVEQALAKLGKTVGDLRIVLELGSNEAIKEAVQRGLGLAFLSRRAVEKDLEAGRLRALRVTDLDCERQMYLVWDRRRVLPPPARVFLIHVENVSPPAPSIG